jgi:hypothetical protein
VFDTWRQEDEIVFANDMVLARDFHQRFAFEDMIGPPPRPCRPGILNQGAMKIGR